MENNIFYRIYLSMWAFFTFQAADNMDIMIYRIYFSIHILGEITENAEIKNTKKKETEKREVCKTYVLRNRCTYGDECMFLHTKDLEIIKQTLCKFKTHCMKRGCQFGHEVQPESPDISDDNCGICWENIYTSKKRFGLLSDCDHKFCIDCVKKHRSNEELPKANRRTCPLCRVLSYTYCSSKFYLTGNAKKKEFAKCAKNRAKIQCRDSECLNMVCGFKHV